MTSKHLPSGRPRDQSGTERSGASRGAPRRAKKSSRKVNIDLPGTYSSQHSWVATVTREQLSPLSQPDRELFVLASEVNDCAESARGLVLSESDIRPTDIEAAKCIERRRLHRMLLAWYGLREESAAPYRDARMLLTGYVLDQANSLRALRDGSGVSTFDPSGEEPFLDMGAARTAHVVAMLYPSLATAIREPDRVARIRAAIESSATSDKRTPWVLIAAVWNGIEKGAPDPERWRKDWYDHQQPHRP